MGTKLLGLGGAGKRQATLALAACVLAAACGSVVSQPPAIHNDPRVVRIAAPADPWPAQGSGYRSSRFAFPLNFNVYEPLVFLKSDYTLAPGLAESWELIQPKTWRFHLRHNVVFHNGRGFTADDVLWTWGERQRVADTLLPQITSTLRVDENPDAVKKVDDFTVDFTPAVPNFRLPEQIVHPLGGIVPRGLQFDSLPPVGSGPFRVDSYKMGEHVRLARNDAYWGTKPSVQALEVTFVASASKRVDMLKAGSVDLVIDPPAEQAAKIRADSRLKLVASRPGREQLIFIKRNDGEQGYDLGKDKAIREAIALSIDRSRYQERVFRGTGEIAAAMAPAALLGPHAGEVKPPGTDLKKAAQVLEDAGWKKGADGIRQRDGRRLALTLIGWAEVPAAGFTEIREELRRSGIDVVSKPASDQPAYRSLYNDGEFDLDLEVPSQNDADPSFLPVIRMASSSEASEDFAPGGDFDAWASKALAAGTLDQVQEAAAQMMRILIQDEFVVIPLVALPRFYAMSSKVDLADPHPSQPSQSWATVSKRS